MVAQSIEELVDLHAGRTPHALAVESGSQKLTYASLAERSRQIAAVLHARQLPPESVIALQLPGGPDLVAAMIGVMRAGLAFLPLHAEAPFARQQSLLRRANARLVLTAEMLASIGSGDLTATDGQNVRQLAYIIFTSGSTGEPKGVMVERGSFAAMLAAHEQLGIRPEDRYLVFAAPHFDGFLVDTFVPLAAGACAVIRTRQEIMPGGDLARTLTEQAITFATIPPAALSLLPRRPYPALRGILTAGDRISAELAAYWSAQVATFRNSYGPTETTVAATLGEYPPSMPVNHIGSPLPGATVRILDEESRPVPTGQSGEIYVGGWGVARGYLNEPALTASRFVPDPFSAEPGARMYRTGDLGSWRPDGNITFHGRRDDELKVRGVRIHPAEVEATLLRSGELRETAVVAAGTGAEVRLVAFVVPLAGTPVSGLVERLRTVVTDAMPPEFLPQEFRCLEALPIGSTGKVDRAALVKLAELTPVAQHERASAAADAKLRERVAGIWAQILGTPVDPDATDSFFSLGGHSLLAAKMLGHVESEFAVTIKYVDFFRNATVAGIAAKLAEGSTNAR